MPKASIEIVEIKDCLMYFYWGRHLNDEMMDMRLGGGSFAIYKEDRAVIIDTMARPGQGAWVRNYLEENYQINHFTLMTSHWHVDRVVDNRVYEDDIIIGHKRTREVMLEKKEDFEVGEYSDYDAFQVAPPNLVFEGMLEFWLKDLKIELHGYLVHEEGHLGVLLPDQKIFIANDTLEDPIWFFEFGFASPEKQLSELERLMSQDIEMILPSHDFLDVIKNGGYSKQLIKNNIDYLKPMLADVNNPDFKTKIAFDYNGQALRDGSITWWEPYTEVHDLNKAALIMR